MTVSDFLNACVSPEDATPDDPVLAKLRMRNLLLRGHKAPEGRVKKAGHCALVTHLLAESNLEEPK